MRIYAAGMEQKIDRVLPLFGRLEDKTSIPQLWSYGILLDYTPARIQKITSLISDMHLIIDSGAFSCWKNGASITLDAYMSFLDKYHQYFDFIVNLDKIPGEWGKVPSLIEVEEAAREGWRNYNAIKQRYGEDKVIHVFHQGEDFKWLGRMVARCQYIGLSPANDRSVSEKMRWLDVTMKYVTDANGEPVVKLHGFAVTGVDMMLRYPWESVDSISWIMRSINSIYVPVRGSYLARRVVLLNKKSSQYYTAADGFPHLAEAEQRAVVQYIEDNGYTLSDMEIQTYSRYELNLLYMRRLSKEINEIKGNCPIFMGKKRRFF
jgi:hypothetical protein